MNRGATGTQSVGHRARAGQRPSTSRNSVHAALRKNEEWYSVLFHKSPVAIALTRMPVGEIQFVNEAFVELFGFSSEECLGKTSLDLGIASEESRGLAIATLHSEGAVRNFECTRRAKSGRALRVLLNMEWVTVRGQQYVLTTLQDITAQRQAEQAKRESDARVQQAMLDSLSEGVVLVETGMKVLLVNEAGRRLLGLTAAAISAAPEAVARRMRRGDGSPFPIEEQPILLALRDGQPVHDVEMSVEGADGSRRWLTVCANPLKDGAGVTTGAVSSFFDITARKEQAQALLKADRQKTEFLGVLSHELRNPLAAIEAGLYLLNKDPAVHSLGERGQRSLDIIRRQLDRVVHQVDELLDITRIANGKIQLQRQRLDLTELVRSCIEDARVAKGRSFETCLPQNPCWIDGDPMRLTEVMANLLENAAKFTPPDGSIRVSLAHRGRDCAVEVADTGIGLDSRMLARLFQPFAQAERQADQNSQGLGLGLALVKGLVELHGGAVSARSDGPGRGACFQVTLPALEGWKRCG